MDNYTKKPQLARNLENLREERGWTKTYVAKKLGLKNMATYANWEYGTREPDAQSLKDLADIFEVSLDVLMGYEYSAKYHATHPDPKGAKAMAMGTTEIQNIEFPTNKEQKPYWELTEKDEKDIQKELEEILNGLTNESSLAFMKNGEAELDEKDAELLRASMEQTLRLSKELAKQKFTPKKYRDKK